MRSHLLHMLLYSTGVSVFFSVLLRRRLFERVKLGLTVWVAMVGGALVLALVMYPFPH